MEILSKLPHPARVSPGLYGTEWLKRCCSLTCIRELHISYLAGALAVVTEFLCGFTQYLFAKSEATPRLDHDS
jgi:hypothetical protein